MGKRKSLDSLGRSPSQLSHYMSKIRKRDELEMWVELKVFDKNHLICVTLECVGLRAYFLQPPLFFQPGRLASTITLVAAKLELLHITYEGRASYKDEEKHEKMGKEVEPFIGQELVLQEVLDEERRKKKGKVWKGSFPNWELGSLSVIESGKKNFDLKVCTVEFTNKMLDAMKLLEEASKKEAKLGEELQYVEWKVQILEEILKKNKIVVPKFEKFVGKEKKQNFQGGSVGNF
eukprot:Gb_17594 [translate_table: standard]